jgi:AcrR family transcriptional regulator
MQRPDEHKRQLIIDTAARFFATQPFHKVRLDDIAAAAKLGKGTLYIYFDSKEDLYFALIYEGFARLVDELRTHLQGEQDRPAVELLERIVRRLVAVAFQNPHFFELMRTTGAVVPGQIEPAWQAKRQEFQALVADTIRRGIAREEMIDPSPELTALCIPGMLRSLMLFGPAGIDEAVVAGQIIRMLTRGIVVEGRTAGPDTVDTERANGNRIEGRTVEGRTGEGRIVEEVR